jgi:DNA-binding XRE family transcriptional regulator
MNSLAHPLRGLASRYLGAKGKNKKQEYQKSRNKLGIAQDDLVREPDVKHATLTKIEGKRGPQMPSVQFKVKLAMAFDDTIEDLINQENVELNDLPTSTPQESKPWREINYYRWTTFSSLSTTSRP